MKKVLYSFIALILLGLTGCGTDGENELVGNLALKDPTALVNDGSGYYHAEMTAVYTHPSKDATGVVLKFKINSYTADGTFGYSGSESIKQPVGGIGIRWDRIRQTNQPIFVDLTVTTGDLSQFKSFTIPALTPMVATPSSVTVTDTVSVDVAVSGSIGPYTITSLLPGGVTTSAPPFTPFSDKLTIFGSKPIAIDKVAIEVMSAIGETVIINVNY